MLLVRLLFCALFAYLGYREAAKFGRRWGRTPWGLHPGVWAVICGFSLLIGGILLAIARRQGKKEALAGSYVPQPAMAAANPAFAYMSQSPALVAAGVGTHAAAPDAAVPAARWAPDPSGRHHYRWWDGASWTEHVNTNGMSGTDPVS